MVIFRNCKGASRLVLIAVALRLSCDCCRNAQAFSTSLPRVRRLDRSASTHQQFRFHERSDIRHAQIFRRQRDTRLHSAVGVSPMSWFYLGLLAIQFGCQPILTKAFAPVNMIRSTYVLAQDVVRFLSCCILLFLSGSWASTLQCWTLRGALLGAGIPSALYLVQNYCALMAYQNLPPVTYNVLNQTKTLWAALCCFLIMGRKQSMMQVVSLVTLLLSALIVEKVVPMGGWTRGEEKAVKSEPEDVEKKVKNDQLYMGVIPVLLASFISGLAGALSQRNLQTFKCNAYVFSMELSIFSIAIMLTSLLLGSPDGKRLRAGNLTEGWTWKTWIPIITNACGGVVVGLVTKHAGAVRKGFALIFGLVLSGILQSSFSPEDRISSEQVAGGVLASISLWMHSTYPPG